MKWAARIMCPAQGVETKKEAVACFTLIDTLRRIAFDIGMIIGSSLATLKHNYLRLFQPLPQ